MKKESMYAKADREYFERKNERRKSAYQKNLERIGVLNARPLIGAFISASNLYRQEETK